MKAASASADSQLLRLPGPCSACRLRGVFTGKHLGARAVVVIVTAAVLEEPVGAHVVVLIHNVGVKFAASLPTALSSILYRPAMNAKVTTELGSSGWTGL